MTDATFSAAEAAVYDRQMRLWGVEAQKRLQNSHVFVSGLSALGAELTKNLALSGMNVTLHDTQVATAASVATQFFLADEDIGKNRAEACLPKVKELNPLVTVGCETTALEQIPDDYFQKFTVVCLVGANKETELRFDTLCRKFDIAFFATRSFGFDGIVFADLNHHTYRRTPASGGATAAPTDPIVVEFPSLADAYKVKWSTLHSTRKRGPQIPKVYIKNQLLLEFQSQKGSITADKIDVFLSFAKAELVAQGLSEDFFTEDDLRTLASVTTAELVPVCAILAGILGQEVIKAISQKDDPICNYFCFDGAAGSVRRIG